MDKHMVSIITHSRLEQSVLETCQCFGKPGGRVSNAVENK